MYLDKSHDQLYFTTTNEKVTGDNRSEITGMKKSDIWVSKKDERGEWQRPEPVEGELNSDMDEGIVAFSPDGQTMYLTMHAAPRNQAPLWKSTLPNALTRHGARR